MQASPSTHFVEVAQAIIYRGGGLEVVWPQLLVVAGIGGVFFLGALARLRRSLATAIT
jgi:ABC-2 type transport system permease protein